MVENSTDRFNGVVASLAIKAPCVAVAIANITLSGTQTVNGVAVESGDRVLVTAQTNAVENGIYDVRSSTWRRSADFDGNRDIVRGTLVTVVSTPGEVVFYQVTTANPITIGSSEITLTLATVGVALNGEHPLPVVISKPSPSVAPILRDIDVIRQGVQTVNGDGRKIYGAAATDMVYRTLHNSSGGTNGTTKIRARFAVEITDLVNSIQFNIEVDAASYAAGGIAVRGIATDDPELSTSSIIGFALSDDGGGLFSFGPWSPSGAKSYYGFEVEFTPVDSTNDETLHDEFFAIEDMTIVQNSIDLLNSQEALSGSTWAQLVFSAFGSAFATQTLPSLAANDVFITHHQLMTGKSYNFAWAGPSGSSANSGTEFDEWDLETLAQQYSNGAVTYALLKDGTYTYGGVKPRDLFLSVALKSHIVCPEGLAILDGSVSKLFSGMSVVDQHYKIAYAETNNFDVTNIGSGISTPAVVLATRTETMEEVASQALCNTTDWSYYWDNSGKEMHVRFDGVDTDDILIPELGGIVTASTIDYLAIANVKAKGLYAWMLDADAIGFFEAYNSGAVDATEGGGNGSLNIFDVDSSDGIFIDCYACKSENDGFGFDTAGHTELYNCISEFNQDDGASHHDDCTGYIQGGRYDFNGKAGVIPAFGASVVCSGVTADGNIGGGSSAQDFNYGGFVVISNDADLGVASLTCYRCSAKYNHFNFLSTGGKSKLVTIEHDANTPIAVDYASKSWSGNVEGGVLVLVGDSADVTVIDASKLHLYDG